MFPLAQPASLEPILVNKGNAFHPLDSRLICRYPGENGEADGEREAPSSGPSGHAIHAAAIDKHDVEISLEGTPRD